MHICRWNCTDDNSSQSAHILMSYVRIKCTLTKTVYIKEMSILNSYYCILSLLLHHHIRKPSTRHTQFTCRSIEFFLPNFYQCVRLKDLWYLFQFMQNLHWWWITISRLIYSSNMSLTHDLYFIVLSIPILWYSLRIWIFKILNNKICTGQVEICFWNITFIVHSKD